MSAVTLRPISATPLPDAVARLERLVSPLTGIVRRLYEPLPAPHEPALIRVAAEATEGRELLGASLDHLREGTGGSASNRAAAVAAAIGEAAERYSAAWVPADALIRATPRELGARAVPPERFALFADAQYAQVGFPFRPFTADTRISWVDGFSIPEGRRAYLPAQLIYLRDPRRGFGETPIGYATSNGLACGPTLEEAILAGLLEAVERDAFLVTWYARLSRPLLDAAADPVLQASEERYFRRTRVQYRVVDLSRFHGVPTCLAIVRSRRIALAVGAAAAPTVDVAWQKALAEAFAVESWARSLRAADPERRFRRDFADIRTFADHVRLYADEAHAKRAAFLDASSERTDPSDVRPLEGGDTRALIEALTRRLAAIGQSAYAVDVTSPDIRDAGLRVVKVLVPGLCQLDASYASRFLGGERIRTAAWRLGLTDAPLDHGRLNHDPHPFP